MNRLRASGGADVQLDPTLAARAVQLYVDQALARGGHQWRIAPNTRIEVGARRVHVLIHAGLPTAFLRIAAIDMVPVEASAYADVDYGIRDGGGG